MSEERMERKLRARFREQRRADEVHAPPFEHFVRAAALRKARAPRPAWVRWACAGGIAAAVALLLAVYPLRGRRAAVDLEAWSALSTWTAATDTFLAWPEPPWGSTTFSTPSDAWIESTREPEGSPSNRKETL